MWTLCRPSCSNVLPTIWDFRRGPLTDRKQFCRKLALGKNGECHTHDRTGRYGKRAPLPRHSFAVSPDRGVPAGTTVLTAYAG